MAYHIIHTTTVPGQCPVQLSVSDARHPTFRVTYGKQVRSRLSYNEAAQEFGYSVMHSVSCAGLIEDDEDD